MGKNDWRRSQEAQGRCRQIIGHLRGENGIVEEKVQGLLRRLKKEKIKTQEGRRRWRRDQAPEIQGRSKEKRGEEGRVIWKAQEQIRRKRQRERPQEEQGQKLIPLLQNILHIWMMIDISILQPMSITKGIYGCILLRPECYLRKKRCLSSSWVISRGRNLKNLEYMSKSDPYVQATSDNKLIPSWGRPKP